MPFRGLRRLNAGCHSGGKTEGGEAGRNYVQDAVLTGQAGEGGHAIKAPPSKAAERV